MAWDSVPWFVGGGAEHSPEVARLLAYIAFAGNEGIVGSGDLAVNALAVPGTSIRVMPGACAILNRAAGGSYQAYAARNISETEVAIAATGSGSGRSDLIVARIEDPWLSGEPWPDPVDPTIGPYITAAVISGVPSSTTTVEELGLGYSAIALARIDIPVSTATITQGMIVDLRKIANPRRERKILISSPPINQDLTATSYADWIAAAIHDIAVPAWATQMRVVSTISGAVLVVDQNNGHIRHRFGSTVFGQDTRYDANGNIAADAADRTLMTADVFTVPSAYRGTTQQIALQGKTTSRGTSGTGILRAYAATTVVTDYEFLEVPE